MAHLRGHQEIYGGAEGLRHHLCLSHDEHREAGTPVQDLEDLHEEEHDYHPQHRGEYGCAEHTAEDEPGEFDDIHEQIGDIHRGIGVDLPDELHRFVHDRRRRPEDRAQALLDHVSGHENHLGTHWTTEPHVAEDFGEKSAKGYATDRRPGTSVVLHANPPSLDDIDRDPHRWGNGDVYGYSEHGEREVPIRNPDGLDLKGISWAKVHSDWDTPGDREYQHHDFGHEPKTAELLGHFETAAEPEHETWYHLTDNPHFALDPEHEPADNAFAMDDRSGRKGIYLGRDPGHWFSAAGEGYARPYLAEVHAHPGISEHDAGGRWGGEIFVPSEHYDKLHLHRVIPIDAHVREHYGDHGWIEGHHGTEFDTGEPLRRNPNNRHYPFSPAWNEPSAYQYPGPDVRDMTPEQHDAHRDRWLDYLKRDRGFDDEDIDYYRQQHDSHRTASRPGRDQKSCPCCGGIGSHGDQCHACNGSGFVGRNETVEHCPGQPQPKRRHWRQGSMPQPDYDPAEELPQGRGVFYRAHLREVPFDAAHARSRPLGPDTGSIHEIVGQNGYSAFTTPHQLKGYLKAYGWDDPRGEGDMGDRDILAFHGRQVGLGHDNEPLVMPEANPHCCGRIVHSRMPWGEFEGRTGETPEHVAPADPVRRSIDRHQRRHGTAWNVTASADDGGMTGNPWDSIRMASPAEYGKYSYPDYPRARTPATLARYFRQHEPDYYEQVRRSVETHGVQEPVLLRYRDPRGTPLKRPVVMSGHHRAAAAWEAGRDMPVGDYDNQEHYDASTTDFGQKWWQDHHELKEAAGDPRRKEATVQAEAAADDSEWGYEAYTPLAERRESVRHILDHYLPSDGSTWDDVRDNMDFSVAGDSRRVLDDVRRSGEVRRPIPIDYGQTPPRVMNGHTRLISADMAGVADVPTRQHHGFMDPDDPDEHGNQPYHRGHWTNQPEWQESLRSEGSFKDPAASGDETSNDYKDELLGHFEAAGDYRSSHTAPHPDAGHLPLHHYQNGSPEDPVRIYRAAPAGTESINHGDWISLSADYAHQHGRHATDSSKDWPVYTAEVPSKHVYWDENDDNEHGYAGPDINHPDVHDEERGTVRSWEDYHDEHPHVGEGWLGGAVHLSPAEHEEAHDEFGSEDDRANVLMNAARAQGALSGARWHDDLYPAREEAEHHAGQQREIPEGHHLTAFTVHRNDAGGIEDIGIHHYQHDHPETEWRRYQNIDLEGWHYRHPAIAEAGLGRREAAAEEAAPDEPDYGQWPEVLRQLRYRKRNEPEMHRGMAIDMPQDLHDFVMDSQQTPDRQARAIADHLRTRGLGMHWSVNPKVSRDFSAMERRKQPGTTRVIVHARLPDPEHIETDPARLHEEAVFRHDNWLVGEKEIPLKPGAPVHVTGVTWYGVNGNRKRRGNVYGEQHIAVALPVAEVVAHFEEPTRELPVHRGIGIALSPEDEAVVGDESLPVAHRARHLLDAVTREGHEPLGQHWTTDRDRAEFFSGKYRGSPGPAWEVMFHATHPEPNEIVTDPDWRDEHEVNDSEDEVPVHPRAEMELTGISWKRRGGQWTRHQLAEPEYHRAGTSDTAHGGHVAVQAAADTEPTDGQPPKGARFFHGRTGTYPAAAGDLLVPQHGGMRHMYYTTDLPTAARAAAYGHPLNERGNQDLNAEALPGHVYEVVPETASGRRIGRHAVDPDSGLPGAIDSYRTKGRLRVLHEVDRDTGEPLEAAEHTASLEAVASDDDDDDREPVDLYRGLYFGQGSAKDADELHRHPEGALQTQHGLGIHWTRNPNSAYNFATDRDPEGWAHEAGEDDEGTHSLGMILHARVHPRHIIEHGTPEWDDYSAFSAVLDPGHAEQETTVRDGAPVRLHKIYAISEDQDGNQRETEHPQGNDHVAAVAAEPGGEIVSHFGAGEHGMAHFGATDWDRFYDKIPGEIHRGLYAPESHGVFSAPMSDEDIAHGLIRAHQEEQFPYDRDQYEKFGTHWTTDEGVARGFAQEHEREHHDDDQCSDHDEHFDAAPVVFHAQRPQRHEIENDPRRLGWQNVDDYDSPEQEVPIRHGAPVHVTGVSWLKHTAFGPTWHRHDLREPVHLRADDRDSPDDPEQWNGDRPEPAHHEAALDVVTHFGAIGAGPFFQQKLFHQQPDPKLLPEDSQRHNPADPHALVHWRQEHEEGYEPPRETWDHPEYGMRDEESGLYRHPGHVGYHCHACSQHNGEPTFHDDAETAENHNTAWTDWDETYPHIPETVHRGLWMGGGAHHLDGLTGAEAAEKVLHLARPFGMHWTGDEAQARHYSGIGTTGPDRAGENLNVVIHARKPAREDIEDNPETLADGGVYGIGYHDDEEIPLREHAPVHVTGVSWRRGSDPHGEWQHHDFPQPVERTAALEAEAVSRDDLPFVPLPPEGELRNHMHHMHGMDERTSDLYMSPANQVRWHQQEHLHKAWQYPKEGEVPHQHETPRGTPGEVQWPDVFQLSPHTDFTGGTAGGPYRQLPDILADPSRHAPFAPLRPAESSLEPAQEPAQPSFTWNYEAQTSTGYEPRSETVSGPFYHGGRARLGPGGLITPGRKPNSWGDEFDERGRSIHTYFSTDPATAVSYSRELGGRGHLYEVEPTGEVKWDGGGGNGSWKTKHPLRVIRKIPREEWDTLGTTAGEAHEAALEVTAVDDLTRRLMREHRVRQGLTPDPTEEELAGYRADAEARRQREQADAEARETERVQRRQQYLHDNGFANEDEHEQFMGQMDRDHDDISNHWRRGHREEYDEGGDWHGDDSLLREHLATDHMLPNPDARAASHEHGLAGLHWQHHVTNRENAHPYGLSAQWRPIPRTRNPDEQALMDALGGDGRAEGETIDSFRHVPVQPYQAPPADYDQMRQHLVEHHGYTPEMHMPRNLPGAQSVHRGLHLPGPIPLPEHQHDDPDDHHDPVFGSLEAPVSDGMDVVAHFEAARDDGYGHFAFYSGHDRDDVEPRTIELEDHLRGDHAYGNWHMDRDLEQARSSAYAGDGTNAAHWRQYHRNMDVLHRQAHDRALDDARSAIEHGAPESHVEDTRRELESAHRPQQDAENEERRAHDEAVAEHREQGSVQMHGNRVEFGEMEAHLREAHGIPHDALPEYRLWSTPRHDPYENALEETHNQAHGEMGSYRHNDEGDWINMHGQPTGAWDAEHHLVQHHGFDLEDLRRDEPSFDEMERMHAENHERDRNYLTHHLGDEMDEEGHLPHHEWGEHDEEQYQATGQIPGYRGQQAQLGEYRHHPDYGELEAPGDEPDVHDTAFSYRHQPYQAAPRSHEDLWSHLREQHGITQSGDTSRMPAQHFLHEVHDKLHHGDEGNAQVHQERWTPHQHDDPEGHHDPVFGSRQAAELVAHFGAAEAVDAETARDAARLAQPSFVSVAQARRQRTDHASADHVLSPPARTHAEFFSGVANWSPQSPAEATELFTDLPGFFDAVYEGLLSVAGHLDDAPVDEAMPEALRHMAGVVLNVAEDARLLASRLEEAGPEGMWETPKA